MMAGGYPGNPEILEEKHQMTETKARTRKPISEFVNKL